MASTRNNGRRFGLPAGAAAAFVAMVATASAQQPQLVTISVQSQDLGDALNQIARQANVQIVFRPELVRGRQAPGLPGDLTVTQALDRMLGGTGLTYRASGPNAYVILAQATEARPTQTGAADEAAPGAGEEIVVTAQRREESIQDVPLSISAIGRAEIERRGLAGAEDYLRGMPGVSQSEGIFGQSIVIRGIETSPHLQNFFSGTTTATYFGETSTTNTAGLGGGTNVDLNLADIERVEVLRGPQGTSFGDSSMGGAVRTIPRAPSLDEFEGHLAASLSETSGNGGLNNMAQGVLNLPIAQDRFAVRAVAYRYEDSGFYRNVAGSSAAFQSGVVATFGAQDYAVDHEEVGQSRIFGGRISALFEPTSALRLTLTYVDQTNETDGVGVATNGPYRQTILEVAPQHVVRGRHEGVFDSDIQLANATAEYDLGWASVLASYSHIESGSVQAYPFGAVGINVPVSSTAFNVHEEDIGEVRIVSNFDGPLNFIAGLYLQELDDTAEFDNYWHGNPAANIFASTPELGVRTDHRTLSQTAAYGEVSWEIVRNLTLTGGVRFYDYDRTFKANASGPLYGVIAAEEDASASGESYSAKLSYRVDNALLYANWSQGFRLGQAQIGLPPAVCDVNPTDGVVDGTNIPIASTSSVNSDSIDNYEIGGKFDFMNRRLRIDASLFHMEWSDMPVQIRPGSGSCLTGFVANAGAATSEGIELQTAFQVTPALRVNFGGSLFAARLDDDVPALGAFEGNRLVGAPDFTANLGLEYDLPLGDRMLSLRADAIHVGEFYNDLRETPRLKAGDYTKVDASARLDLGAASVELFGRNLTDEDAFTYRGIRPTVGPFYGYQLRPRTFGLQVAYDF